MRKVLVVGLVVVFLLPVVIGEKSNGVQSFGVWIIIITTGRRDEQ
jgi:hypothetical protein